ncbi:neuromedin-U receptor 2-like [Asterias amurensis]|uniref:neuromedin-U receptor 2-like n=1 Tax=Asterias amurensis TaxID=7602 RepID=UPI003AB829E7
MASGNILLTEYVISSNVSTVMPTQVTGTLSHELVFQYGVTTAFKVAYGVVMVPAILGNIFILMAIACHAELRSQHTNVYVANLAVCDLMVVVMECPFAILQFLVRGEFAMNFFTPGICRLTFFVNSFFGTCSILTMLAIGVERYCAVMHPFQTLSLGENAGTRARNIIFFFWSFTVLTHLGQLALFGEIQTDHYINQAGESFGVTYCLSAQPEKQPIYSHIYAATAFLLVYGSTFLTTLVLYVRILKHLINRKHIGGDQLMGKTTPEDPSSIRRRVVVPKACSDAVHKTFRMLSCSVLSYAICYSLYFYVNLYYIYFGLTDRNGITLMLIANWFGAVNSLINPIVYTVFVDQFRTVFGGILTGKALRRKRSSRFINAPKGSRSRQVSTNNNRSNTQKESTIVTISNLNATPSRPSHQ